jgi:hypothetical protein
VWVRDDLLGISKRLVPSLPILFVHPSVVDVDDVGMGAVVRVEGYGPAGALREEGWKFKDVPYSSPSESVQTLVIVPNNTDVVLVVPKEFEDFLLDCVCVLIFVHHEIG